MLSRRNPGTPHGGVRPAPTLAKLGDRAIQEFRDWAAHTYGKDAEDVIANYARNAAARDAAAAPLGAALDHYPFAQSWGAFFKAIRDPQDRQGARAAIAKVEAARPRNAGLGERTGSGGGFLVPWRLTKQVFAYMEASIIRPRCSVVPMTAPKVAAPVLDNPSQADGAQALGGMAWSFTPEGQAITATVPKFGRVVLEAWPDKALLKGVPNELLDDAASAFSGSFLPQVVAKGLSWHVDDVVLYQGTGAGQPQSLPLAPAALAVTRNTSGKVLHADVVGMLKALHPASKGTATWLASEDVFDQLLELYELVGSAPTGQDIPPPNVLRCKDGRWELFGLELIPNGHQPAAGTAADLMLADLEFLLLGELGELTVDVSSKGSGFATDASDIRFRFRWDSRFWPQQTITLANGKVTSPLVVLQ